MNKDVTVRIVLFHQILISPASTTVKMDQPTGKCNPDNPHQFIFYLLNKLHVLKIIKIIVKRKKSDLNGN